MKNDNREVVFKALEFLNNLYTNFDTSISEKEKDDIKKNYYQEAY